MAVSYQVGYWPIIGKIFLHDMPEGRVNFQYRVLTNSSTFTGNVGDLPLNSSGSGFPTTTTTLGVALTAGQLRVTPSYSGASMSAHDVFSRVLAVMVVGAETGPESPCNGIVGRAGGIAGIDITPERDEQGHSLLKYRQLIKAMRIVSHWMVAKKRFGEVDFELKRDGVKIAQGRLQNFRSQSLASQ